MTQSSALNSPLPADSVAAEQIHPRSAVENRKDAELGRALPLAGAVLYVLGIGFMVSGAVGGFLWAPLLWLTAAGLVLVAVALTARGGDR